MVRLTEAMVIAKSRMENITQIRNLNMWGNDLTDVSILQSMPNVEVVSLSINRISSLGPFASCRKLVELYLRKNEVSDLDEVVHLQANTRLRILWLGGNPCSQLSNYRLRVIRALPQLQKLDDTDITPQEREQALLIEPPLSKQAVLRPATSPANLIATPSLPPSSTNTAAQNANLSPSTQSPHTASNSNLVARRSSNAVSNSPGLSSHLNRPRGTWQLQDRPQQSGSEASIDGTNSTVSQPSQPPQSQSTTFQNSPEPTQSPSLHSHLYAHSTQTTASPSSNPQRRHTSLHQHQTIAQTPMDSHMSPQHTQPDIQQTVQQPSHPQPSVDQVQTTKQAQTQSSVSPQESLSVPPLHSSRGRPSSQPGHPRQMTGQRIRSSGALSGNNVLTAVTLLLKELDDESLVVIRDNINTILATHQAHSVHHQPHTSHTETAASAQQQPPKL